MPKPTKTQLQAALQALRIDVPYYSANRRKDGSIAIRTRDGTRIYKPPQPKPKSKPKATPSPKA